MLGVTGRLFCYTKQMLKKIAPFLVAIIVIIAVVAYSLYQKYMIAATVNGTPISRLAVIAELEKQGGKKVLDTIITQELLLAQAKKENVSVSQAELDKEFKKIEITITEQGGTLDEALKQKGMTKADLSKEITLQVMVQKLVKADQIKITDKEVEDYMKANKDQFPADAKTKPDTNQIKETLKQQKLQIAIQKFITDLHTKAKINYFGAYK